MRHPAKRAKMSGTGASAASAGSEDEIRLRVETISGQVIHLTVSKRETVLGLKTKIFSKQGIPVAEQNLMFLEEELKDFRTLEEYNIIDSCTIRLSIGMKGGPINTRRTLYLDDKNTIHEMAKMLAANDISVVLVPHNGAYHVIPVSSEKRDGSLANVASGERRQRHNLVKESLLMTGQEGGRRIEENNATKNKMAALQKQFKKKRSAPDGDPEAQMPPIVISRQGGCCATKSLLSNGIPPSASSSVALVAGAAGGSDPEHQHKVVVPRLITSHKITLNELNQSQTITQYYTTTTTADGGGAFESSSSYASGVDRNLVIYPNGGPSGSSGTSSSGGDTIFVSPYNGLFRCTADTTENASKEDVSSGGGRCSSAAAAPPPTDNSPTVVERPQTQASSNGSTSGSTGSSGPTGTAVAGAKSQLLASTTPSASQSSSQSLDEVSSATSKDEVKAERRDEPTTETSPKSSEVSPKEPEVSTPPKKKHPRCATCNKKTGLASSYTCRCGGNFCATHRYAEAHDCAHDYKTEGRQLLERSNPLIQAAKLQKI